MLLWNTQPEVKQDNMLLIFNYIRHLMQTDEEHQSKHLSYIFFIFVFLFFFFSLFFSFFLTWADSSSTARPD